MNARARRQAAPGQGALFSRSQIAAPPARPAAPGPVDPPPLDGYDVLLVNISGGKDSQATLDVAVHVRREVTGPDGTRRPQGLIDHIAERGKWPDAARRYCTSDTKRAPVYRLMTRLAAEQRAAGVTGRPVRILNILGLRAQESPRRALMTPFRRDERASNGVRHVDEWLPVHAWTTAQVWDRIERAGTRPHPVYAQGMPRLSCRFCVLASRSALVLAAQLDPDGARRRAELETAMGHQFRADVSMAEIIADARAAAAVPAEDWAA